MKKIIFIHLFNDRSGSPKVLSKVVKAIKAKGYQTELLTSDHKDGFLTAIADINRTLFYRRSENKLVTLIYYVLSQTLLFFQCLRYRNQDVIFYINTMMPFGAALSGKLIGKRVIYHVHETSLKPEILKKFLRGIIAFTADKIIFVSKYLKEVENFRNKKQVVIYNALESHHLLQVNKEKNDFIILMVCSLKEYKGIFEFIKLADLMNNIDKLKFYLVLNATQDEIDEYFTNITKTSNLTIHSRQTDLSKFYQEASLLLNLSRPDEWIETFGLTILEGMEYGLPVIVPPVGGPAEIVRKNVDGFCISCYELEKVSEKILYLMKSDDVYNQFSQNVQERFKDFNISIFEKKIINVIKELNR